MKKTKPKGNTVPTVGDSGVWSLEGMQDRFATADTDTVVVAFLAIGLSLMAVLPIMWRILRWITSSLRLKILVRTAKKSDSDVSVSGLFVHPVKSMRSIPMTESTLDAKGLSGDRRFMVVTELPLPIGKAEWGPMDATHRFLTQRQCPSLAKVSATIETTTTDDEAAPEKFLVLDVLVKQQPETKAEPKDASSKGSSSKRGFLAWASKKASSSRKTLMEKAEKVSTSSRRLVSKSPSSIRIPLSTTGEPRQRHLAGIWDDVVAVDDMGDAAAAFLQAIADADKELVASTQGGTTTKRVRLVTESSKPIIPTGTDDRTYVPPIAKSWTGGFLGKPTLTDGFPILIASEASLTNLNEKLVANGQKAIPMSRFRPNIVLKGDSLEPFVEDTWKTILIGDVVFAIVKACPRCKQSCTDQVSGVVSKAMEPLTTMKTFRRSQGDEPANGSVFFAQNAIPIGRLTGKSIKVGDTVTVLETGPPVYID